MQAQTPISTPTPHQQSVVSIGRKLRPRIRCKMHRSVRCILHRSGGGERVRTDDPLLAKQVLSQLSYTPKTRAQLALER